MVGCLPGRSVLLQKSQKRAIRRWRSFTKWMRRLKSDWAEHGWRRDPIGPNFLGQRDGTTLCNCFFLDDPAAYRFKDTPNNCNCWTCRNPRHLGKSEALTIQEKRAFADEDDRSNGRRKRRKGYHPLRHLCDRCGFLLRIVYVRNHTRPPLRRLYGNNCPGCRARK